MRGKMINGGKLEVSEGWKQIEGVGQVEGV